MRRPATQLVRFGSEKGPWAITVCPSTGVELFLDYLVTVPDAASVLRAFGIHHKENMATG